MRLFAISNIHGHYDAFLSLLKEAEFNPQNDKLVVLGDILDYGPKSYDTIELCMKLRNMGAMILRGDREQMYITAFTSLDEDVRNKYEEKIYKTNNHLFDFYLDNPEIRDRHINFFKTLNPTYHFEDFVFSHAGTDIGNEAGSYNYSLYTNDFYIREDTKDKDKTYVFGHVPVVNMKGHSKAEPFVKDKMIGIDFGGRISSGHLGLVQLTPERKFFKVKAKINYKMD